MSADETIRRFEALADSERELSAAEVDELVAALASRESVERYVDDDPGWSGFGATRTETDEVADVARRALARRPAATLAPVARAYASTSAPARERVRALFAELDAEAWAAVPANARAAVVDALSRVAPDAPDRDASERLVELVRWYDAVLGAVERRDERAAIPLLVEGVVSGEWRQERAASRYAASFAGSEALAGALASVLLDPTTDVAASAWFASALEAAGARLPADVVGRLAEALDRRPSSAREWALLTSLAPYADDRERLDPRGRAALVRGFARLCLTTPNEGHFPWAIGAVGGGDLVRELEPTLSAWLASPDDATVRGAAWRAQRFGPAAAPLLLPGLAGALDRVVDPRSRLQVFRAIADMGAAAEPAIPALLRALDATSDDAAVSALGAIGPAAAVAVDRIRRLRAAAGRDTRMYNVADSALERITGSRD